jgi:hypothetical protein
LLCGSVPWQHQPPFSPALLTFYVTLFPHWMCWCCCAQGMSGTTPGGARSPSPHLTCRTLPCLDCPRCVLSSDARGCLPQACLVDVAPSCSFPSSLSVLLLSCWCGPVGGGGGISGYCSLVTLAEFALCVLAHTSPLRALPSLVLSRHSSRWHRSLLRCSPSSCSWTWASLHPSLLQAGRELDVRVGLPRGWCCLCMLHQSQPPAPQVGRLPPLTPHPRPVPTAHTLPQS